MLKDLFGGDAMVENVKIVPDRNVSPLLPGRRMWSNM
jgi:RNA recognition motif-containing protein